MMNPNVGMKKPMDMGTDPKLTTQGQPTRVKIQEKMANITGNWDEKQYAGYKGAPDAKVLKGGSFWKG